MRRSHQPSLTENAPIHVAVVGHTNTGKTSLIRTLLRNDHFGRIANSAGTTRHVERALIQAGGNDIIALFDTPGLEDASSLLDILSEHFSTTPRTAGIRDFLTQMDHYPDFEQEAKVLKQGLSCHALLYVIDVRFQLLEKYQDEIQILSWLGKPIIPVFNFVLDTHAQVDQWRQQMIHFNLHASLEFDTVAFDFEAEKRLYQKLQSVLESHYVQIQTLIQFRSEEWQRLCESAIQRIILLLETSAGYRIAAGGQSGQTGRQTLSDTIQNDIRKQEQQCLSDVLSLFSFTEKELDIMQLPVSNGRWQMDLFSPQTLKLFGLNAGSSALTGAAAGAGLDLMVGGLSLGAAALLGATLGAGFSTLKRYGKDISSVLLKQEWLCTNDTTIELLYLRGLDLLLHLTHRGHASLHQHTLHADHQTRRNPTLSLPDNWKTILKGLRSAQLNDEADNIELNKARQALHHDLTSRIHSASDHAAV